MDLVYPPGPTAVPPNLTAASAAYKRHAWFAMLGLGAFLVIYLGMAAWFGWTSWRLLGSALRGADVSLWGWVAGGCAAFLAIFMLKALFFIQHRHVIDDIEVTRAEQPRLFEFIDRLADEAKAPRAHRVFLSPRVNAAVFYDLSLLNLIVPSKKNLEIGLGLVNTVPLGELKAVLAHEFGHFAQRSMAVGRWVYISQQIAGHIVARRDVLDKLLHQLSRFDLRVAWIGWILSLTVWSIRSLMDILFRGVVLAQRALSRQMEFQADLVAVSLTGSDALIHALHRLGAADDAWDKTLSFANSELAGKRGVKDLFAVQTRVIVRMREILGQPAYGGVPPLPATSRERHRVFKDEMAQPPRMWSTHPPSCDREKNAKQQYVPASVDERSAWELFTDPQTVRERMSAHVLRDAEVTSTPEIAESLAALDKSYERAHLDRAYRGTYLNRSVVRAAASVDQLFGAEPADVRAALATLYPESLARQMERLGDLHEEKHALIALRDQVAIAPGGVIRHRGSELARAQLPGAIASVERELEGARDAVAAHDRQVRSTHLAAARLLGNGWPEYLRGLAAALHYADHSEANLRDAQGLAANVYGVVTADGRVSSAELDRLVKVCHELHAVLKAVYDQAELVQPDATLLTRLEVKTWPEALEEFKLGPPHRENMGDWLNVIDGWVNAACGALGALRSAALEQLLVSEARVSRAVREGVALEAAPAASVMPKSYATLLPGAERTRQKKLDWWDRFHTADGAVATVAKLAVAATIVGGVMVIGATVT
jgi:Zn-dependent protease with chaperone function